MTNKRSPRAPKQAPPSIDARDHAAATQEAQRRLDARDDRSHDRLAHDDMVRTSRDALGVEIGNLDRIFMPGSDEHREASRSAATRLLALERSRDPIATRQMPIEHQHPSDVAPCEVDEMIARADRRANDAALLPLARESARRQLHDLHQLRAALDGVECPPLDQVAIDRGRQIVELAFTVARGRKAVATDDRAWFDEREKRAQPGESLEMLTARVLVEMGSSQMLAVQAAFGFESRDVAMQSAERTQLRDRLKRAKLESVDDLSEQEKSELEVLLQEQGTSRNLRNP